MRWLVRIAVGCLAACSTASAPLLEGRLPDGRTVRLLREPGGTTRLIAVDPASAPRSGADLPTLWPPIVDSHVHLAYWDVADQLAERGVLMAVDLGAPLAALDQLRHAPISIRYSGPMLTRRDGYPLDGWGREGYGLGCDAAPCVQAAVADLAKRGASVVKIAFGGDGLDPSLVGLAVTAAHRAGLRVAAHALGDADAALAAAAGCDVLAHTPLEPLAERTVEAWRGRVVISTLAAFGGSATAIENLRRLRAAGATILYGTDLGNLRDAGPSRAELALLRAAGLDDAAIVEAMTTAPARFWASALAPGARTPPYEDLGSPAALLVLSGDPRRDVRILLTPRAVLRMAPPGTSP